MKYLIFAILLSASTVWAAPFLVCDMPTTGTIPTEYQITLPAGQTWITSPVPALTTGTYGFKADISNAPTGTTSISVKACKTDPVWGTLCSPVVTYPLSRPLPPLAPVASIVAQ